VGGGGGAGGAGGATPAVEVVLNELVCDPEPGLEDWIELHNVGSGVANVTGWSLSDGGAPFVLPSGSLIAAGGYLTFDRNAVGSFTFGLGKAGETLTLRNTLNVIVDSTTWTDGDAEQPNSWGRSPNGTGNFQTVATTKNGPNP